MHSNYVIAVCNNAYWYLSDFENSAAAPLFQWSIDANQACKFTAHAEAVAVMRTLKHCLPDVNVRLFEARSRESRT